jgi:hypothetical protein
MTKLLPGVDGLVQNPDWLAGRLLKVFSPEKPETPMTFLTFSLAALSLGLISDPAPKATCLPPRDPEAKPHVFTNADLERMAACRYQTGAESRPGTARTEAPTAGRATRTGAGSRRPSDAEADWRAQWRSIDQKTRRLRREARALRQEADEAPRDPKKRPTGRRSPTLLEARARALEAEARELEDEFQARARRAGALPGWLRPRAR